MSVTKVTGMMQTSTKGGDISSASPTVIDTDGDYFDITGTTNFAAFTVVAGRRFTVQFDGALTMTHHATNLDLPGGANITTAAGDVAEFFATGTNTVQCVNYTKADGTAVVAAAGGAWTLIGTSAASDSATLDQTGLTSTYDNFCIMLSDIITANDGVNIYWRMGDSGGIDSGGSDYGFIASETLVGGDQALTSTASDSKGRLNHNSIGNVTNEGLSATMFINYNNATTLLPSLQGQATYTTSAGTFAISDFMGVRTSSIVFDRIQFLAQTGNITSGRLTVWGISHA